MLPWTIFVRRFHRFSEASKHLGVKGDSLNMQLKILVGPLSEEFRKICIERVDICN
jgi:hypothetical protein